MNYSQPRKIIVSGASRGIGLATAKALLDQGHQVIGISRSESPLATEDDFFSLRLDLMDSAALESDLKTTIKQHPDVSGLINNAGGGFFGSLEEFSTRQIQEAIQLNLLSAIMLTRSVISTLKKQSRSDIVFIGSEAALAGAKYGSLYSAAKFGMRGFSQSLRHECSNQNCHVCIINPGMVRTSFFDKLSFEPGIAPENAIRARDVAAAILSCINTSDNTIVEEITLNPAKFVVKRKS